MTTETKTPLEIAHIELDAINFEIEAQENMKSASNTRIDGVIAVITNRKAAKEAQIAGLEG